MKPRAATSRSTWWRSAAEHPVVIGAADSVPLGARSWIGDGWKGGTVAPDGTLDWWASEGIEAPAEIFSLLDPRGGAIRVGPVLGSRRSGHASTRVLPTYREGTNVVDLDLAGVNGTVRVTDLMPWPGPNELAPGRVVRIVTARSGPVEVEVEVRPGQNFGAPREVSSFAQGVAWGPLVVRTGFALDPVGNQATGPLWRGSRTLAPGETLVVTVDRLDDEHHQPLSVDAAARIVEGTVAAWRSWAGPLWVDGPYRAVVERAALTLRTLSGVGAPLAAGTTSLPRRAGTERTTDERVVRWRDAAAAAQTLARVGLYEDAEAAEDWLRIMASTTLLPWPSALRGDGSPVPTEDDLSLAGWRHSQPVRVGGGGIADLDLYGDVAAAISASTSGPGPLSAAMDALARAADWVTDHWEEPDGGVWSLGGPSRLLSASRLQAWCFLDGMGRLARVANPLDLAPVPWQQATRVIQHWLESDGLAADGGLRLEPSPADHADAALLRVAWRGPWPPGHPVVSRTVDRTLERLSSGPWVLRHSPDLDDGRPGPDSPDLLASLWAVRALAALERWEEAHDRMEGICALVGTNGIFSTAADPLSGELLGNLPSAGVHLAVIDAALALNAGPP